MSPVKLAKFTTFSLLILLTLSASQVHVIYKANITDNNVKWTVMFYLDGDNDLEHWAILTFEDIARIGSTKNVRIVVQFDRSGAESEYGGWSTCKRYLVTKGLSPSPNTALCDLGEVDMGDPNVLLDFMLWAVEKYPADRYILILWNHGGAIAGVCVNSSHSNDRLSLPEIRYALSRFYDETGIKLDIIVVEACLMGCIELTYEVHDYANYIVFSEEVMWAHQLKYDEVFKYLVRNPGIPPYELAILFAKSYLKGASAPYNIMSVVNLSRVEVLYSAFDEFSIELIKILDDHRRDISLAIAGARGFYVSYMGDIYSFAESVASECKLDRIRLAASTLMSAINTCVVFHGNDLTVHGISAFIPRDSEYYFKFRNLYSQLSFSKDCLWPLFLEAYYVGQNMTTNVPEVKLLGLSGKIYYREYLNVTWRSRDLDNDTVTYRFYISNDSLIWRKVYEKTFRESSQWKLHSVLIPTQNIEDGGYMLKIVFSDGKGGVDIVYANATIYVDKTPPVISDLTVKPMNPAYNETVTLSFQVSDNISGVDFAVIVVKINNSTFKIERVTPVNGQIIYMLPSFNYGSNVTVEIEVSDKVGNIYCTMISYTVQDPYPPEISNISISPEAPTQDDTVTVKAVVVDDGGGIKEVILSYFNGSAWINVTMHSMGNETFTGTIPALKLKQGMFKVIAVDVVGNVAETDVITYDITLFKLPLTEIIIVASIAAIVALIYTVFKRKR
ncbi:hypothetical protein DRO02_01425 [archaeon]|nr:MAG: hypothetical protein DRO02_01425 [archaeon]